MNPTFRQWPGFRLPFGGPPEPKAQEPRLNPEREEIPDHHSQLEDLLGHVRRCERWARLDDRIDLSWRSERGS